MDLRAGDVLGASVTGAATDARTVYEPGGREVFGSTQDASFIYPASSPLPGGGNAVVDHVADATGRHYLAVLGGAGQLRRHARGLPAGAARRDAGTSRRSSSTSTAQRVNTAICGGPGVRQLSPLSASSAAGGSPRRRRTR